MSEPPQIDFGLDFKSAPERLAGERDERLDTGRRLISYNVSFLDDLLAGIAPHDLILLGARSGAGKTELAAMIAKTNAAAKKRVHYFALEGEPGEIERRTKYSFIASEAWRTKRPGVGAMTYRRWRLGLCEDIVGDLDAWAERNVIEFFGTLFTYYRGKDFTAKDLGRHFHAIQNQTDLIILDHLHYVDSDDTNENRAFKNIIKAVRDSSLSIGVPVICIAHLRKADKKAPEVVPDMESFHGSSDIFKIATQVITLAKSDEFNEQRPWISPTYMHVAKDRMDGATRFAALMGFDRNAKIYEKPYKLGRLAPGNTSWEPLGADEKKPFWAGRSV